MFPVPLTVFLLWSKHREGPHHSDVETSELMHCTPGMILQLTSSGQKVNQRQGWGNAENILIFGDKSGWDWGSIFHLGSPLRDPASTLGQLTNDNYYALNSFGIQYSFHRELTLQDINHQMNWRWKWNLWDFTIVFLWEAGNYSQLWEHWWRKQLQLQYWM